MQRRSDGESTAAAAAPETVCAPAQDIIALNYELEQVKGLFVFAHPSWVFIAYLGARLNR